MVVGCETSRPRGQDGISPHADGPLAPHTSLVLETSSFVQLALLHAEVLGLGAELLTFLLLNHQPCIQ
jgi:hypothetical protein